MDQSLDEAKKSNENYANLIGEIKNSNEKTLNEIKALNENQVLLLEILAGKFAPQNNDANQNNNNNN